MTTAHKVGNVHHYGLIMADALKYDDSGHTVTMYEETDMSGYYVVEWDKTGEYEIATERYTFEEKALISYLSRAFGVSL